MKHVLVTGGTGSLGSVLVPRLLSDPAIERVVVFSRDELKQSQMAEQVTDPRVRFFLGDVRDWRRLLDAFKGIDTVIHTAALKRVDAVVNNPQEILKTNVLGTQNVLDAATWCGVNRVLVISSDKACEPINIYGASKMYAEHLTVNQNVYSAPQGTACSVLRYGNVLGSRGSVVHTWRDQAARGELMTVVTGMTRFVILMRHAVDLVLRVCRAMYGGDIFVPVLPRASMRHLALATSDAGLIDMDPRPGGEKYHETLLTWEEAERACRVQDLVVIRPALHPWRADWPWVGTSMDVLRSDASPFLTVPELRALLVEVP